MIELRRSSSKPAFHIVKHLEEGTVCTIAYWIMDTEGYYLQFVGNRPFLDDIPSEDFMILAKIGQEILDIEFEQNQED